MKRKKKVSQMTFLMWLGFTGLAVVITMIFWVILSTSMRYNYKAENIENLLHSTWSAVDYYGTDEFESNLQMLSKTEGYNVALLSEGQDQAVLSYNSLGNQTDGTEWDVSEMQLFDKLDANGGFYQEEIEDNVRDEEWAVTATVIANIEGNRQVLIISKSMTNVNLFIKGFWKQIIYALLVSLGAASLLAFWLTRFFAGPINELTKHAEKLVQGDYKIDFPRGNYAEVQQLSHTLELAAEKFDETDTMRKEFIANVSHDMKTPLTIIKMYTEMLLTVSGDHPVKREEHLKRIDAEATRLNNFVVDNLELARLQVRNVEVQMKDFDITVLIDNMVQNFEIQEEVQHLAILKHMPEAAWVHADYKLISRVMQNLISNALKFSKKADHIDITVVKEPGIYRISVRDYGVGIAEESIPYVWDRYYRVNAYGADKTGTGIGLHIVKAIMDIHESAYGVISELEKGSEFWIVLPQAEQGGGQNG